MRCFPNCPDAVALVHGGPDTPQLSGRVRFYQGVERVLVIAELSGLPQDSKTGFFALHIHEGGTCTGEGFSQTGGHYDTTGKDHPNHAGDLPPLLSCDGSAYLAVWTDRFRVCDVIGRTVVIHDGPDDFHTQPSGNAGSKIGCGVICERKNLRHL